MVMDATAQATAYLIGVWIRDVHPTLWPRFLVRVISSGRQALDAVMLEMGHLVAESVMLIKREAGAGPDS